MGKKSIKCKNSDRGLAQVRMGPLPEFSIENFIMESEEILC